MKNLLIAILACFLISSYVCAKNIQGVWHNDIKTLFGKNSAVVYVINIRTFNAKDLNGNDIIDEDEESGNFLNAVERLDDLVKAGINTVHVMPVTPVGKIKAFGTAGSLYAPLKFDDINPQLVSKKTPISGMEQAKQFVNECHKRNLRVIFDMPGCGSYDMFLEHPEYFVLDKNKNPVIPLDWTDVRLFDCGDELKPNTDLLEMHKKFIDMILSLGVDGVRADAAGAKPPFFWKSLIEYAQGKSPDLLFLAESSNLWTEPVSSESVRTSPLELFKSGFDCYLGDYHELKNWKTSRELISAVKSDLKMFSSFKTPKSVLGSFSTHDEISPVLIHGSKFSKMIIWLNTTLPLNSYYVDGFPTGAVYNYKWANKCAKSSMTDDEYYFVHNGKPDIFNFSTRPQGDDYTIYEEFVLANKFKNYYQLADAKFVPLKSSNPSVFAYARAANNFSVIVFGNLDFANPQNAIIKIPKFKHNTKIINLRIYQNADNEYLNGKIKTTLDSGDIQVMLIKNFVL